MARKTVLTEAMENTIESMLMCGKRGCDIADALKISTSSVTKVRKKLIAKGKGALWHTTDYLVDRGWA